MLEINIPSVKTFFEKKGPAPSFVNSLFKKLNEKKEERVDLMIGESRAKKIYLIVMEGDPLGAFYIEENSFLPISGRDYFNFLQTLPELVLSYYAIDPVFAKCLLIPSQNKPVYKGPIVEKDLKKKIGIIQKDPGEHMILLKENDEVNFFYFKCGQGVDSYFCRRNKKPDESDIGNQFLTYVLERDVALITMEVYHNPQIAPLLKASLTPDDLSAGIIDFFQKQKPEPTPAEKLEFEQDIHSSAAAAEPLPVSDQEAAPSSSKMQKGKWYLELVGGEQMGRRMVLNKPQLTIGRMKADLMLSDVKISRQHAMIELTDQGYRFTDLGSTNGSFINGQPVKTQLLKPGDIMRLGGTLIKILVE